MVGELSVMIILLPVSRQKKNAFSLRSPAGGGVAVVQITLRSMRF